MSVPGGHSDFLYSFSRATRSSAVSSSAPPRSSRPAILFSFFTNQQKLKERYPMTMSQLVADVSKAEVAPSARYLVFELCCTDEDEEDVEVPFVKYRFRFD